MTDLVHVLPDFPTAAYTHLIPSLEKHDVTVADLLTLDPTEIVKRCPLPLLDIRRLVKHVIEALQCNLGLTTAPSTTNDDLSASDRGPVVEGSAQAFKKVLKKWDKISTLDERLDQALGGGIPTGYVTEVTGERYDSLQMSLLAQLF